MLKQHGINRSVWYVLVGWNTPFEDDIGRLEYLKDRGQRAFVTRYVKTKGNLQLARWANQHNVFAKMSFREFMQLPKQQKYYEKYTFYIEPYLGSYLAE